MCAGWQPLQKWHKVCISHANPCYAPHGCLHHFRIVYVCGVLRAYYSLYTKPVGYSDYCSEIARVLYAVKGKPKTSFPECRYLIFHISLEDSQNVLWMLKEADFLYFVSRCFYDVRVCMDKRGKSLYGHDDSSWHTATGDEVVYNLTSLCNKKTF